MEEWKVLGAHSAEATAAAAMRIASEMRLDATDDKNIVRDAYKEIQTVEEAYNNQAALGFRDAGGGDLDLTLADTLRMALDIATGVNNGSNAVLLAKNIKHLYHLINEPEGSENE